MSLTTFVFLVAFFILLTLAYVKGYEWVKRNMPVKLPQYHLLMVAIRMILAMTVAAIYIIMSHDRVANKQFAITFVSMYLIMLVMTLTLKH